MFQDYSGRIQAYVINVAKRLDRYVDFVTANSDILPLMDVIPFQAVSTSDQRVVAAKKETLQSVEELSNRFSFAAILKDAKKRGLPHVLVMEDDVYFTSEAKSVLTRVLPRVPTDFSMLMLGVYLRRTPKRTLTTLKPGIVQMSGNLAFWGAHAVVFSSSIYDRCIENYENPKGLITDHYLYKGLVADTALKCCVVSPLIAFQRHNSMGMHGGFPFKSMEQRSVALLHTAI